MTYIGFVHILTPPYLFFLLTFSSSSLSYHRHHRYRQVWYGWLENIHDWCVSRQLWWGHRIPAYYVAGSDRTEHFVARSRAEAEKQAVAKYGVDVKLEQEDDVLDTWFR